VEEKEHHREVEELLKEVDADFGDVYVDV